MSGSITEGHARAIAGLGDVKLMVDAYKTILSENASVRRAEDLARRLKSEHSKKIRSRVERIHNDELDKIAQDLAQSVEGLVKITQSKVEARVVFVIRGSLEKSSQMIKKIHKLVTS